MASFFIGEGGPDPWGNWGIMDKVGALLRGEASEFHAHSVPGPAAAASYGEIIKNALRLYEALIGEAEAGNKNADGAEVYRKISDRSDTSACSFPTRGGLDSPFSQL
jgi:hypothetical protein